MCRRHWWAEAHPTGHQLDPFRRLGFSPPNRSLIREPQDYFRTACPQASTGRTFPLFWWAEAHPTGHQFGPFRRVGFSPPNRSLIHEPHDYFGTVSPEASTDRRPRPFGGLKPTLPATSSTRSVGWALAHRIAPSSASRTTTSGRPVRKRAQAEGRRPLVG